MLCYCSYFWYCVSLNKAKAASDRVRTGEQESFYMKISRIRTTPNKSVHLRYIFKTHEKEAPKALEDQKCAEKCKTYQK